MTTSGFVEKECGIDCEGRPIKQFFFVFNIEPKANVAQQIVADDESLQAKRRKLPADCIGPDGSRAIYHVRMGRMMGVRGG